MKDNFVERYGLGHISAVLRAHRKEATQSAVWARPIQRVMICYATGKTEELHHVVAVVSQDTGTISILYRDRTEANTWRFISKIIPREKINFVEVVRDGTDPEANELKEFDEQVAAADKDLRDKLDTLYQKQETLVQVNDYLTDGRLEQTVIKALEDFKNHKLAKPEDRKDVAQHVQMSVFTALMRVQLLGGSK